MTKSEQESRVDRVVIAINELSPINRVWSQALQVLEESRAELHVLFVEDERWHRAASLPFTREFSRFGGLISDFTSQRAVEVHKDAVERSHEQLRRLAAESERELAFEVLPEANQQRIRDLVAGAPCVVIVHAVLADQPAFKELRELGCRIVRIET